MVSHRKLFSVSRSVFAGTVYGCFNVCIYTFIQFEINAEPLPRAISPLVENFSDTAAYF